MDLALEYQECWNNASSSRDSLYSCRSLSIRRDCKEALAATPCNAEAILPKAYLEACLIHIPDISWLKPVVIYNLFEPLKPPLNLDWIL